ncbi:hypothetical protein [Streptomyces sp. NPDC090994]|uniref:hypothetical protein n=1 Tax=Streptomyces sp. NPDC090994 TaxID=3365969 RepID=UPI003825AD35
MSGREHDSVHGRADASGTGSVGIGSANQVIALMLGAPEWKVGADKVQRWTDWPQFFLVFLLEAVALSLAPDAPVRQLGWVYALMAAAFCLSLCRVAGLVRAVARRNKERWSRLQPLVTLGAVLLASLGVFGMDHYAGHGEVDVTGLVRITGGTSAADGRRLTVTVENEPRRSHLRLALELTDAVPGAQSCVPATTYDAKLAGSSAHRVEDVRGGETFSLPLGGVQGEIEVDLVLHSDRGCRIHASVAEAALHD